MSSATTFSTLSVNSSRSSIQGYNPVRGSQIPARPSCVSNVRVKNTFLEFSDDTSEDHKQLSMITPRSKTVGDRPSREDVSSCSRESRMSSQPAAFAEEKPEEAHATECQSYTTIPYCEGDARHADIVGPTTMMIRNFPNRSPIKYLVAALDSHGFAGTYDFIHAPYCFVKKQNFGYAFINFRDPALARAFLNQWQGQHIFVKKASVPVNISQAQIQGKAANLTRLVKDGKTKKITNPHLQPIVFDDDGHRVEFSAFVSKYVADIHTQK
eukprot:GEMP01044829.1.p1 GENE.GEMP01044829.1~~GEMP01044829.1.p1  ORF type:complete len:269 (+),score=41.68 GEMP01044829.1:67-873(+)